MEAGGISTETQGMSAADIEKMRKEMEDEIRSQLLANQAELAGAEGTGPSWDEKVVNEIMFNILIYYYSLTFLILITLLITSLYFKYYLH